ncbi:glycosyltransferase family 2 protein [Pontibacter diazotrophicus]|uniref:Glycosyltransferase family 2 protein n=1 Tax=Pontibacter diazotrophicus TaxID=1400979 RepID=A0A3D8LG65_9BACT|nr:glycosyltransferase family 2 protein [Pontibacter diazotrophicus]RDV16449.1 glycosyltransferase family 2 protein [Pontibacter diazotrophicus]
MVTNVAGVIVLYNPQPDVIENIKTYSHSVKKLFAVDNSEKIAEDTIRKIQSEFANLEYIPLHQNKGIATALNVGATKACEENFEWLLTMDQDSKASKGMVQELLKTTETIDKDKIGIIAPRYILDSTQQEAHDGIEETDITITSGNLLNLKAFAIAGPFRDELFIDYVDHEYCLRLWQKGYKVLINNNVEIFHQIGTSSFHTFFGMKLGSTNHNYIRRYYITRNRLEILNQFKKDFPAYYHSQKFHNLREIGKVILFEADKLRKIKSFIKGYMDYKRKKFGKYKS